MTVEEVLHQDSSWDEFVAASPYGDILQTWEWGEVRADEVWSARRIRAVEDGITRGQALVLVRQMPMGMKLYYVPRGPVLDYGSEQAAVILESMLAWVKTEAAQRRGLMIKVGPPVSASALPGVLPLFNQLGLKQSFHAIQTQHTIMVDLDRDEAEVLKSFDKDTRNLVRRAAKEGVVVDRFDDPDDQRGLRFFHNMYRVTADRAKFSARSWGHFLKLWRTMAGKGMAFVYLASFEEAPLAGSLVLKVGSRAYQLYGASRRDEGKKYAPYALQWAMMQDLKAQGVTNYDMWGVAPDDSPEHSWAGITLFKKGFGGQQVNYVGDFDLPLSPTYPIYDVADKLRTRVLGGQRVVKKKVKRKEKKEKNDVPLPDK